MPSWKEEDQDADEGLQFYFLTSASVLITCFVFFPIFIHFRFLLFHRGCHSISIRP